MTAEQLIEALKGLAKAKKIPETEEAEVVTTATSVTRMKNLGNVQVAVSSTDQVIKAIVIRVPEGALALTGDDAHHFITLMFEHFSEIQEDDGDE